MVFLLPAIALQASSSEAHQVLVPVPVLALAPVPALALPEPWLWPDLDAPTLRLGEDPEGFAAVAKVRGP